MDQYDLQRAWSRVTDLPKPPSTMLQAIEITRELHIISKEEGVPYEILINNEFYRDCPLCEYSGACLFCPWMLFESCMCEPDEYKDNKRSIERLTRWIDKIEGE